MSAHDRVLPVVPMFHANAWGLAYAAVLAGADLIMPDRFLQPEPLARLIASERPTLAGAVPTIWNELLRYLRVNSGDLSSLRMVLCGGSAVPHALMEAFETEFGVRPTNVLGRRSKVSYPAWRLGTAIPRDRIAGFPDTEDSMVPPACCELRRLQRTAMGCCSRSSLSTM